MKDIRVDYYNTLSRWGKELNEANQKRVEETLDLIPTDICTILDLGCGDGTISNPLISKGFDVTGVDISLRALYFFKGKAIVAKLHQLPFRDRFFDLVICAEVLEHLPKGDYEGTLREIERVARKYIIVCTPHEEYLPSGFLKCSFCGSIYHMNLHVRVFDRLLHHNLFKTFGVVKLSGLALGNTIT